MVQMPTFRKWRWNLHEESPECFMSTWGCRTSVLNILYPTVSMCTHRHTIRNFETLKNLCFSPSPVVGSGILHTHFCAFGCTYMCLLGVKTCFGPFEWFSSIESIRTTKLCVKLYFWYEVKNTTFLTILPLKVVLKPLSGAHWQNFLGTSGPPNVRQNDQKGLLGCGKAQINVPNSFRVLRKRFWNFRKIVEFATFRQRWLGQYDTPIPRFCILKSEKFLHFYPPP